MTEPMFEELEVYPEIPEEIVLDTAMSPAEFGRVMTLAVGTRCVLLVESVSGFRVEERDLISLKIRLAPNRPILVLKTPNPSWLKRLWRCFTFWRKK